MTVVGLPDESIVRWLHLVDETKEWSAPSTNVGCPHIAWAACGAMALTGEFDDAPSLAPGSIVPLLTAMGTMLSSVTGAIGTSIELDAGLVLSGRAGAMGLSRRGRISAGGATRMLPTTDGWCAVSLSRPDDADVVPAILGRSADGDPWQQLGETAAVCESQELAARFQLLGVPAASLPATVPAVGAPWQVTSIAPAVRSTHMSGALVVDLSSLWAGPLCAQLLGLAGARVVKVESTRRPDGARVGNQSFFDSLHSGHESVSVDFTSVEGRAALADLVAAADIVIEASRPRALAQLGLAPEELDHRPGKVWVSITGYGRNLPDLVALGDDAAVAGGLVSWSSRGPVFCGDAIADPLTGVIAALGAAASLSVGGGHLVDVSMRDVAAAFAGSSPTDHGEHAVFRDGDAWVVHCPVLDLAQPVLPPRRHGKGRRAARMGSDTTRVLSSVRSG